MSNYDRMTKVQLIEELTKRDMSMIEGPSKLDAFKESIREQIRAWEEQLVEMHPDENDIRHVENTLDDLRNSVDYL